MLPIVATRLIEFMPASRWTVGDPATPLPMRMLANFYVWVFGRKSFYGWNQRLLNLAVRGMGVGNPTIDVISPTEARFLRSLAASDDLTVFDVGAHVGEYASHVRELSSTARVWSFEPHPGSYKKLSEAASEAGFEAVNMGLSDHAGRMQLYDHVASASGIGSAHATLHAQVIEGIHHGRADGVEVEVTTIDAFMKARGISHVTLLKVDAEGHELAILRGAQQAIASGAIDVVQFEFNEMNVISRVFFKDFYDVLPGFSFYRMVVDGLAPIGEYATRTHEVFILHNVIAMRPAFASSASLH
jgi:FkbM family methyltransferase